jgi:hypothetical protein
VAALFKEASGQPLVDLIIFRQQNSQATSGLAQRVARDQSAFVGWPKLGGENVQNSVV